MHRRSICACGLLAALLSCDGVGAAATSYFVRLRPAGAAGLRATVALDLTHSDEASLNRAVILSFARDGAADSAVVEGGPGYGDLLAAANPAESTTLVGEYFYNSLAVPFETLGSLTTFRLNLTEEAPAPAIAPDEFSMYLIDRSTGIPYSTADGLGTGALFAIDVTGGEGGELSVFDPMAFVAPDTLTLDQGLAAVLPGPAATGRLRLSRIFPNPSSGPVRMDYDVPPPGGKVSIVVCDLAGRRVAALFNGTRPAGPASVTWGLTAVGGKRLAPGAYFVQLRMAGQTVVGRLVVVR